MQYGEEKCHPFFMKGRYAELIELVRVQFPEAALPADIPRCPFFSCITPKRQTDESLRYAVKTNAI